MSREKKWTAGRWQITGGTGRINQIGIGIDTGKGIDPIGCVYGRIDAEETKASARLFAEAPALVEALEACRESLIDAGREHADSVKLADAVLARAYGEDQK